MVQVAVAQFAPGGDVAVNLAALDRFAGAAADRGARLLVLPEYTSYFSEPMGPSFAEHAQALDGPFVDGAIASAARHRLTVVFGLVEAAGARFRNTVVAVTGDGVVASYRKTHLYDAFGATESRWVEPGDLEPAGTFPVDGLVVGLQTCYDLRFPEVTRVLADAGADLVLVPAEWVPGPRKVAHWRTLLAARSIENTAFVAAADHVPPAGVGTSLILGPSGEVLAELGGEPGMAVADLDPGLIAEVRLRNPALALRRYRVVPR